MEKDIDELLTNWHRTKQEIAALEKKCDRYKKLAGKLMDAKEEERLVGNSHVLTRRNVVRESVSKKDIPETVWKTYCKKVRFDAFYFQKNRRSA